METSDQNKLLTALKLLSPWNVTEITFPTKLQVARILGELYLDEKQEWPLNYTKFVRTDITKTFRMYGGQRKCIWDKNGALIFFADLYEEDLGDENIKREYCTKLEPIKWKGIISFIPKNKFNINNKNDYSDIWEAHDKLHCGNLCGYRVDLPHVNNILQSDLHISLCRRYIYNISQISSRDVCSIILNYLGSCSFRDYCEYILHSHSESIRYAFVKELMSDIYFPWGMHFNDIVDYLVSLNNLQFYLNILYDLWFDRKITPLDRYYQEYKEEKLYPQSKYHIFEETGDIDVIQSVKRRREETRKQRRFN